MKIVIDLAAQTLRLLDEQQQVIKQYQVSTAAAGIGEQQGSMQTPRGLHVVRAKIGAGLPIGAVLRGRRPTGEVHTPELAEQYPERDWILSRILWLSGCQPGFNRLGQVDSMRRYIYIHGTPDDQPMGIPASHGCVRMRNADVVELFELVPAGIRVLILERAGAMAQQYAATVPSVALPALLAELVAVSLPLPPSPAPVSIPMTPRAWALWRNDGCLLAVAGLQSGAGMTLWQAPHADRVDWPKLISKVEESARAAGWAELRTVAVSEIYSSMNDEGLSPIRPVPDSGVLMRKFL